MDFTLIVALVIALALIFDFTNGFHDTANAMATPIATGAMRPKVAVGLAAILNLVGAFLSTEVARTISGGIINKDDAGVQITPEIIFAGLIGAIVWNLITWLRGLPSSSSHALFGGLIGATIIGVGSQAVAYDVVLAKVILPALIAPLTVGIVAYLATRLAYFITRRDSGKADGRGGFRYAQIISSSLVALAHGTNDAQKTMGVITLTLIAGGMQDVGTGPQLWVITTCAIAIAIGTYTGGWRIIRTMGRGLTDIKPAQGFAAETSTAATILASSQLGFALSTTQVASGSVIGSGLGRRGSTVRWGMAGQIALGWVLTLPAAAIMGAFAAGLALIGPMGIVLDLVIGSLVIAVLFRRSRQSRVTHDNLHDIDDAGRVVKIRKTPRKASRTASRKDQKKVAL
ncbi:inorganic phosphate transporter [Cryobacterium sp. TMT2-17-1]|uniref:Phosphate transporter n=1 Tax=Cryobacterium sandaracinum TaxID=1259247 RepID=A0ABY2J6K6_9MICO|nr:MULTISPECIES: inorganic phosphate transporter [Cryobacterium]TFB54573.1 inorganic phosphate transporter [Cryobacterium sp. Sr3]TFB65585.1 inorganic phosphate transporter [Cryobacterium sp. Hz7]TFC33668.1 inorganic phosphate transporter [Cryobacterium sp. TMT2-14]TFC47711.1 inorganic phosphate transporter [Cryobacterium sp. TMT2-17-1]TFC71026.1 inorganic phosphate transporter [Cryobacterium sp. TMT2-4]